MYRAERSMTCTIGPGGGLLAQRSSASLMTISPCRTTLKCQILHACTSVEGSANPGAATHVLSQSKARVAAHSRATPCATPCRAQELQADDAAARLAGRRRQGSHVLQRGACGAARRRHLLLPQLRLQGARNDAASRNQQLSLRRLTPSTQRLSVARLDALHGTLAMRFLPRSWIRSVL